MRMPTPMELEALDWFSRRRPVRRSSVPWKLRPAMRRMLADALEHRELAWLAPFDVELVECTAIGRALAAAYRHGRAALPLDQRELEVAE